ncbi:MAG: RNA polymerase sigma factor [Akkermansia sp.]|nr:RNA polymerase sigma factor [Akkermansia sp.]MBQ9830653.1 RNA polymerase sigma factor [Akkermansia sp.]
MDSDIPEAGSREGVGRSPDWESWLTAQGDGLLLYARQRTTCEADAEDVLQSALLKLVHVVRSGEFRKGQNEWKAFVISCIRNAAIDLSRSRARRQSTARAAAAEQESVYESAPWLSSRTDAEHRRRCIERVLRRMRADYAEVVMLHVWQGLSFRTISDITGENPATVATRYRAALRIFRQQLEQELNPPS